MAKSKRNKVVNLSKISKKNFSDKKVKMVTKIHKFLDEYTYCYAFHHKNMTTLPMAEVRNYWSNSVFLFGKNKVMQVALGKDESDEYKKNSSCLSEYLNSSCGLLFTNEEPEVVIK